MNKWDEAQKWESSWWSDCCNTLGEEIKQLEYAKHMGLEWTSQGGKMVIDAKGKSILDIGGGPVSMLLKVVNSPDKVVVDPCEYPEWIGNRYDLAGITHIPLKGEEIHKLNGGEDYFDEIWIYNCLQHADDPKRIIEIAKKATAKIRIFEWVLSEQNVGHPHVLTPDELDSWLGGHGTVERLSTNGCNGLAYFGVFNYDNN